VDDLFLILDPSEKSLRHVEKVRGILKAVEIKYTHFYLIANYMFDEEAVSYVKDAGEVYLGKIELDSTVEEYNLKGESLLKLPDDSPACVSVRKILQKAGLV
jgi:CO dehydrogenase maturation factor